jgi:hypothetical protein
VPNHVVSFDAASHGNLNVAFPLHSQLQVCSGGTGRYSSFQHSNG